LLQPLRHIGSEDDERTDMNDDKELLRDRLLEDHTRLNGILTRLLAAFEANDREDMASLWTQLESGLTAHMDAEEKYLLPVLARTEPAEARDLLAEHAEIRSRLLDLGVRVDLHTIRLDTAQELIALLRAHAGKEDEILYSFADKHLDAETRGSVLRAIGAAAVRSTVDLLRQGGPTP
jgi:hemerythrin-like domain-containing protein